MFAGHEGGTEQDMMDGGYHFAALKGTTFMDPQVVPTPRFTSTPAWRPRSPA